MGKVIRKVIEFAVAVKDAAVVVVLMCGVVQMAKELRDGLCRVVEAKLAAAHQKHSNSR